MIKGLVCVMSLYTSMNNGVSIRQYECAMNTQLWNLTNLCIDCLQYQKPKIPRKMFRTRCLERSLRALCKVKGEYVQLIPDDLDSGKDIQHFFNYGCKGK
jgi:hypothetical protein